MNRIALINIEYNCYSGYIFELLNLELFWPVNLDSSLFGINVSRDFFYVDILFFTITIFGK